MKQSEADITTRSPNPVYNPPAGANSALPEQNAPADFGDKRESEEPAKAVHPVPDQESPRVGSLDKSEVPDPPDHEEESELDTEASQFKTIKWRVEGAPSLEYPRGHNLHRLAMPASSRTWTEFIKRCAQSPR